VLFLADGVIVDELRNPDRDQILAKMARLQDLAIKKAAG
jgi:putative ABC transport system ATP-binding protein